MRNLVPALASPRQAGELRVRPAEDYEQNAVWPGNVCL